VLKENFKKLALIFNGNSPVDSNDKENIIPTAQILSCLQIFFN
jgi:hypothetical protein